MRTETRFETAPFKLLFFDGNSTMDMGNIFIHPCLNFKSFQSIVSKKIGVSPNQITTYYERGPLPSPSGKFCGTNRRSPVTSKFNFASVGFDPNCFFFVVLKRSRRLRNRNKKNSLLNYPQFSPHLRFSNPNFSVQATYCPNYAELEYPDYQRSRMVSEYLLSRYLNSVVYSVPDPDLSSYRSSLTSDDGASTSGVVCEMCEFAKKEGQKAEFHPCSLDAIVTPPFRSPFGPIAPPTRKRDELV